MFEKNFYNKTLPNIGELVYTRISNVTEYGINVVLPEYSDIEAMIMINEVSRKVSSNLQKKYKVGSSFVCRVVNVDKNKNFIDLTKRQVSTEESDDYLRIYKSNKKIIKLVEDYIKKDDSRSLNSMMEFTFWAKDTNNFLKFLVDSNFDLNLFDIDDCEKFMSFLYDKINNKQQVVS